MKNKLKLFSVLCISMLMLPGLYAQYTGQVDFNPTDLTFEQTDGYDVVTVTGSYMETTPGKPYLPVKHLHIAIPEDKSVAGIEILNIQQQELSGTYNILPAQLSPIPGEPEPDFVDPDPDIYNMNTQYPADYIFHSTSGFMSGVHIAGLLYYPLQYNPVTQKLYLTTHLEYRLVYTNEANDPVKPRRMMSNSFIKLKNEIKGLMENPDDVDTYLQVEKTDNFTGEAFAPDEFPNFNGQPVNYVIITNDILAAGFQEIADWKTQKGMPAVVKTVEWIYSHYSGVDQAEKIRNFIKDAYQNWGTQYFMLGGDSDVVPIRVAWMSHYNDGDLKPWYPLGLFIPADMYFACLDRNWNADGDATFGEADWDRQNDGTFEWVEDADFDQVDRLPDVYIGRVPVEDYLVEEEPIELNRFNAKFFEYVKTSQGNENNAMVFCIASLTGWINPVFNAFPQYVNKVKRYGNTYNSDDIRNELNGTNGTLYHFACGLGHGGPTSFQAANGSLNRSDMDNLVNTDRSMILYLNHCKTMPWDYNTVAEHFISSEYGGVAVIANTFLDRADGTSRNNLPFIQKLYNGNYIIGNLFKEVKIKYNSNTYCDNLYRIEFFSHSMSADPAMPIWTDSPDPQNPLIVNVPANVYTGGQTIAVEIDNLAVGIEAFVCFYKEEEIYARETVTGTGSMVTANMECTPDTPGDILVTVTAKNYLPVEMIIPVSYNPGIHLFASEITIDDDNIAPSNGNNDGKADAGETAEINVSLTNNGLTGATGGDAILTYIEPDPPNGYIMVTQPQAGFGNISSLETVACFSAFVISISTETPDQYLAAFELNITDGQMNTYQDELYIEIHAPDPQLISNTILTTLGEVNTIDPGDHVEVTFEFYNGGTGMAAGITGELSNTDPPSPYVQNINEPVQPFGDIASHTSGSNQNFFEFDVTNDYNYETIEMLLTLNDEFGKEWLPFEINFDKPDMIIGMGYTSTNTDISLYWNPDTDAKGYNVYRSNTESGDYSKLNSQIITGFSGYTDAGLPELTTFYYKVCAVSNAGIEGDKSEPPLEAWTTLPYHPDWLPITIIPNYNIEYGYFWGAPNIYDLDNNNKKEIFFVSGHGDHGSNEGAIFGFKHDGEELYDIDENPTSISGFANIEISMTCSPAIGDIDNDGIVEIVVATRMGDPGNDPTKYKLYVYKNIDTDDDKKPDLMREKQIAFKNFNGVVLADLDNNSTLEIIVPNQKGASIEIFDYEGNYYSGWPVTPDENPVDKKAVSMPVVVDFDDDGNKEIIIGLEGGIYIWNSDGSDYLGQNPLDIPVGGRLDCPVIAADIDNDNEFEILFMSIQNTSGYIYALEQDGTLAANWDDNTHSLELSIQSQSYSWSPAFVCGDVNNDGLMEVVFADNGILKVWDYQGNEILNIQIDNLECQYLQPLIANIDDDESECEIIVPSNNGLIHAYKLNGNKVVGWPLNTFNTLYSVPLIDDIDNDSKNEIIVASDNNLYIWDSEGNTNKNQWDRFRLNSYNNAVLYNSCSYNPIPLVINEDKTWVVDKTLNRDLHINQGTLTINSTVKISSQAKIIVKPGAELIVDGGKLINGCNESWQGIEVWGDKNSHQFEIDGICAQGKLVLKDALIENAYEAIRVWEPGNFNSSGGIIIAENTTIRNCRRAAEFISYRNYHPYDPQTEMNNLSYFKNCTFEIDENYNQPSPFNTFISQWKVKGVDFYGCRFHNLDNTSNPYGIGVISIDAGYSVTSYCDDIVYPCPPENIVYSEFSGFQKGIECSNEETSYYVTVKHSNFSDNIYGIYNNGSNNQVIVLNNFETTKSTGLYSINILLNGCTGFSVEENNFTSTFGPPYNDFYLYGIWVNNSGEDENLIYKNNFSNMYIANHASGINLNERNEAIGLKYECNTNLNNVYDFYVDDRSGISTLQGSVERAAGNTFTHNTTPDGSDFANNGNWIIQYYYDEYEPDEIPENYYGLDLDIGNDHPCLSNFGIETPKLTTAEKIQLEQSYSTNTTGFDGALTVYNSFKDEGNTSNLVSDINNYQSGQTNELRGRLLYDSPHLSEEALKKAADKWDVLPHNILFEILSANPDEMGDEEFLDYLANKPDPLPEYMIEMLRDTIGIVTYKTILKNDMSYYSSGRHYAATKLLVNELADTSYSSLDSLRYWLNEKNNLGSEFSEVDSYLHDEDTTEAVNILASISNTIELNEWAQSEVDYFTTLKNLLITLKSNNQTIFDIDSIQKLTLNTIADSSNYIAGTQARGILHFVFQEDSLLIPTIPDTTLLKSSPVYFTNPFEKEQEKLFKVIPNPAKDWLSFEYIMPTGCSKATIEMFDQIGRPIFSFEVCQNRGVKNITLETVPSGTYLVLFRVNGKIIEKQKIVITK